MELADLGRLRCRSRRAVLLRILRAVSNDAGFSMGESFALWNWGCVVVSRSVPCVRPAATLSRQNFRLDLRSDCCARYRVFQLCNLLRRATGARFNWRAARWPKGARLFTTGSKWKSCRSRRFALGVGGTQGGRTDFLSRLLVTAMQLRVAEFSAKTAGVRGAWR